jgi:hypothetical protein
MHRSTWCGLLCLLLQSLWGVTVTPLRVTLVRPPSNLLCEGYLWCGPLSTVCVGCVSCGSPLLAAVEGAWGTAFAVGCCGLSLLVGGSLSTAVLWLEQPPFSSDVCVFDSCSLLSYCYMKWLCSSPNTCCCYVTVALVFSSSAVKCHLSLCLVANSKVTWGKGFIDWISEWGFGHL